MASEAHLWKIYEDSENPQKFYYSPMAPNKPNKHTLETYYSEWDISMAGSVTVRLTLKIYRLLNDKENTNKFSKFPECIMVLI